MSETQGQIHGLISREQMHDMWLPYGERLTVGSEISDDPTPNELVMMYLGSSSDHKYRIAPLAFDDIDEYPEDWPEHVYKFLLNGANEEAKRLLLESYAEQLDAEQKEINFIQNNHHEYLGIFAQALGNIAIEGIITDDQADLMRSRLYDNQGNPFMQEAPMTMVRMMRVNRLTCTEELLGENLAYVTALDSGLIWQGLGLRQSKAYRSHNRSHELLHSIQGIEVYDITRDDGLRIPIPKTSGHFSQPVSTKMVDESDFSTVENTELTEGFIEFLNFWMHKTTPEIGPFLLNDNDYLEWQKRVATIQSSKPKLFASIVEASLAESTPTQPNIKKDALAEMHEHGEFELGPGGLTAWMQSEKQFSEVYSSNDRPDVMAAALE